MSRTKDLAIAQANERTEPAPDAVRADELGDTGEIVSLDELFEDDDNDDFPF